jgi:hypothetical protein
LAALPQRLFKMTDDILPYAVSVSETDSDSSELVEVSS